MSLSKTDSKILFKRYLIRKPCSSNWQTASLKIRKRSRDLMERLSQPWVTSLRLRALPNILQTASNLIKLRLLVLVASSSKLFPTYLKRRVSSTAKWRLASSSTEMPFPRVRVRSSTSIKSFTQLIQTFLKYKMLYPPSKTLLLATEISLSLPRMPLIRAKAISRC